MKQPVRRQKKGTFGRIVLWGALIALVSCFCMGLTAVGAYYYFRSDPGFPKIGKIGDYRPKEIIQVVDRKGNLIGEIGASPDAEHRILVPLTAISDQIKKAFIAAEDAEFYEHNGISYMGVVRAAFKGLVKGKLKQGASTITQQIVKRILLTPERTLKRKALEMILAIDIEQKLSKDEILWLYLNQIYFGHAKYGVEEASRFYFGVSASQVTDWGQAAYLAGLPKSPDRYSPARHPDLAKERQKYVLDQLVKTRKITQADANAIAARPYVQPKDAFPFFGACPEVVDYVRAYLVANNGDKAKSHKEKDPNKERELRERDILEAFGGAVVKTTIDAELEIQARVLVNQNLDTIAIRQRYTAAMKSGLQSSVIVLEPKSGEVLVLIGGKQPRSGDFNRALMAERQPGSTMKAALYAAAFMSGEYVPDTPVDDEVRSYSIGGGRMWTPQNYEGESLEDVTIRKAFAHSLNTVAVSVLNNLGKKGITDMVKVAQAGGVLSKLEPNLSLALGTSAVKPIEMATLYATFANRGTRVDPVYISSITVEGKEMPGEAHRETPGAINKLVAEHVASLMRAVVEEGTASSLKGKYGKVKLAGKTGTTDEQRNAWFITFTDNLETNALCATWVGRDGNEPIGRKETGAKAALPVCGNLFARILGRPDAVKLDTKEVHEVREVQPDPHPEIEVEDPNAGTDDSDDDGEESEPSQLVHAAVPSSVPVVRREQAVVQPYQRAEAVAQPGVHAATHEQEEEQ